MNNKNSLTIGSPFENEDFMEYSINNIKPGLFNIKGKYQGHTFNSSVFRDNNKYHVNINGSSFAIDSLSQDNYIAQDGKNNDPEKIFAPMTGVIREILVNTGDGVILGQLLLRIESMKLVLSVNSAVKGIIKEIRVKTGQRISAGDFILELKI